MKNLKLVVLAVFAVSALTMVEAGSASANELCSTNTTPCTGVLYGAGTTISGQLKSGTTTVFTNSISNVTCKKATFDMTITIRGGGVLATTATLPKQTGFTFSECSTSFGSQCTATVVNLPYEAVFAASGKGNGTLTLESELSTGGHLGATIVCGFLINCTFTTRSATLSVTGGNPAIAKANEIALERSGGFCPLFSSWDAEYEFTSPKPLFLV